jgi:formate hydrogenlyase subunit 3/multisubunit Na+/H+ antiporter MnhD subunit
MGFLFFFALLLKTAVLPLQFWLISFYKHLPLSLLFTYFGFYYIYFVVIILNLFFGYLYAFAPLWYWYSLGAFGLTVVYAAFNLLEATTLRGFFAYSSVINLFMLFIFMLSMFDGTFVISGL